MSALCNTNLIIVSGIDFGPVGLFIWDGFVDCALCGVSAGVPGPRDGSLMNCGTGVQKINYLHRQIFLTLLTRFCYDSLEKHVLSEKLREWSRTMEEAILWFIHSSLQLLSVADFD